ncbi:DMT family transporter [Salibacterium salarium]|nr:DMT family transporter [Salibacterium salarium]
MRKGVLFFIISMMSIGLSIPIGDVMMVDFPVFLFTFITILIASIILIPFASIVEKTKWGQLGWRNYFGIFMQALLTVTLYTVFQLYGLTYAGPVSVGIITSITPAVVLVLSVFLLRERLNLKKISAVALAIIAVLIMEIAGVDPEGGGSSIGILFMLLAVVSLSLFFIYAKKFTVELPPYTLAAGLCFFGMVQTLPMAIYEFSTIDLTIFSGGAAWLGIIGFALTAWVFAYAFTYLGITEINASTAGMASAVIPIVATATAIVFFGAPLRGVDMVALVLVVGSIIIAEYQERTKEIPSDSAWSSEEGEVK